MARGALLLLLCCAGAGCQQQLGSGVGGPCAVDGDCAGGDECARTGECAPAGTLLTIRISCTIDGVTPTPSMPAPCAGVDHLTVSLEDLDSGDATTYAPVTCTPALITFNKMPARLDRVSIEAVDAGGASFLFGSQPIPAQQDSMVAIDLR